MDQLMTVREVASAFNVSQAAVYKMVERGKLKPVNGLPRIRFDPEYIEKFLGQTKRKDLQEIKALKAELEQVKRERDLLRSVVNQVKALAGVV